MLKLFNCIILIIISLKGFGQCESNKINFVDSKGTRIDSTQSDLFFPIKDSSDTLHLEPLYDIEFTHYVDSYFFSKSIESNSKEDTNLAKHLSCPTCRSENIKVIKSIDINGDGIKELFLFRKWNCGVMPNFTTNNRYMYLAGGQQQVYGQYEIWDIKSKKRIFEVKNIRTASVAITTNVISNFELYNFEVTINKKGSIIISNSTENHSLIEKGKYNYNKETGSFMKEE
ncbi:MAG: hypothetical protein ACPGVD_06110 [Flavobacteriales bacterium]